ncbi:MAG TPA: hypothetical protein VNA25_07330 [Phycisphaerae bacterium]|nr:hypothetical protein [Phycisphaerae bacterium]
MPNWLRCFIALGIIWMSGATTPGLEAQNVSDTITITIVGNVSGVILTGEYLTPFRVGDTAIFRAEVVDEDGAPINALISFFTEDATALSLEVITDPTVPANIGQARGIALKKATVRVWVVAEPITEMRLATFRDGNLNWSGFDSVAVGGSLQYCAYLTRGTVLVVEDPGPPACPTVFLPATLPAEYRALSRMASRSVSRSERFRLARGLPVNPGSN